MLLPELSGLFISEDLRAKGLSDEHVFEFKKTECLQIICIKYALRAHSLK